MTRPKYEIGSQIVSSESHICNNSRITQTTLQGTTLLNLQYRDGSRLRDQNEDTKQKAQYLYTASQHLTQHRDRNASDNSMNTTPADLQITADTEVLHYSPPPWKKKLAVSIVIDESSPSSVSEG